MAARYKEDVLPCDHTKVHGLRWSDAPPEEWRGRVRACTSCHQKFLITAAEQRFWYEELRIPMIVQIKHCPMCRRRARAARRLIGRMSELTPKLEAGTASMLERRELVLTIAAAARHPVMVHGDVSITLVGSRATLESAAGMAARLRREDAGNDDLLIVQIHIQRSLGNVIKAERLTGELGALLNERPPLRKAMARLETWFASPTRRQWALVAEPARC